MSGLMVPMGWRPPWWGRPSSQNRKLGITFLSTQEAGAEQEVGKAIKPQTLFPVTCFFQQGFSSKVSITFPNSATNLEQSVQYTSQWGTSFILTTTHSNPKFMLT